MKKFLFLCLFLLGGSLIFLLTTLSGCVKSKLCFLKSMEVFPTVRHTDTSFSSNEDTLNFDQFYFGLEFEFTLVAQRSAFGNNLYALQLREPGYINVDKIKEIRLITLYPYNQFTAGSDASSLLSGGAAAIDALNQEMENRYTQFNVELALNTPPDHTSRQQFVVELISENNTILRDTTYAFYLRP